MLLFGIEKPLKLFVIISLTPVFILKTMQVTMLLCFDKT